MKIFNFLHIRLQFTVEVGIDDRLSFFDTMLLIEKQSLVFDEYCKTTFSDRFLNFNSQHPLCHKRGVIYRFVDKIMRLCHLGFSNLINSINIF